MKIRFYYNNKDTSGDTSLEDILEELKEGLPAPERRLNKRPCFLETCSKDNIFHKMDFTLRRISNGPGHSEPGLPTEDFELGTNGGFGEQTAVAYDPKTRTVAVQFNQNGLKAESIAQYLSEFLPDGQHFSWTPFVKKDTFSELLEQGNIFSLECKMRTWNLPGDEYEKSTPLGTFSEVAEMTNAGEIEMQLSCGGGLRGGFLKLETFIRNLLRKEDVLIKFRAKQRTVDEEGNTQTKVLDFLDNYAEAEVEKKELKLTEGLRYSYKSRIFHVCDQLQKWQSQHLQK